MIRWKKYGKTLNGYEGLYQISNLGRVKSLGNLQNRKEKLLKTNIRNGYYATYLYKNNKKKSLLCHRLVAEAFIPNSKKLPMVNHKDENKLNNCVNNLEWCTSEYNINYSSAKSVVCVETGVIYHSLTEVSKKHNIQLALLSRVCDKDNYRAGGFHWKSL